MPDGSNNFQGCVLDPPSGWKYGFPKAKTCDTPLEEWLLANGYPQYEIDNGGTKYIRILNYKVEDDRDNQTEDTEREN